MLQLILDVLCNLSSFLVSADKKFFVTCRCWLMSISLSFSDVKIHKTADHIQLWKYYEHTGANNTLVWQPQLEWHPHFATETQ